MDKKIKRLTKSLGIYKAESEKTQVVFLPSGRMSMPKGIFDETEQVSNVEIIEDKEYYSAQERAEFLYEAITAKDEKGEYLFHNI